MPFRGLGWPLPGQGPCEAQACPVCAFPHPHSRPASRPRQGRGDTAACAGDGRVPSHSILGLRGPSLRGCALPFNPAGFVEYGCVRPAPGPEETETQDGELIGQEI